jgi:hypothetical protein
MRPAIHETLEFPMFPAYRLLPIALLTFLAATGHADERSRASWGVEAEAERTQTTSNTLQKPNNSSADRFDVVDYTGRTDTLGRLSVWHTVDWWRTGSELRLDIVPVILTGTQSSATALRFNGTTFQPDSPLTVLYRFNTYRFTFDLPILEGSVPSRLELRAGGTIAIRDAQIRLKQSTARSNFINYGPVPLAYGFGAWHFSKKVRLEGDIEAFPAPGGGGLLDASSKLVVTPGETTSLFLGVRYVTGGAVDNSIYNFLHQRSALAGIRVVW